MTTEQIGNLLLGFSPEEFVQLINDFANNGKTIADMHGMSKQDIEAIYSVGYSLYNSGNYEKAHKVFQFLCWFAHLEAKYWLGLGAVRQQLKQYPTAIEAFSFATMLDITDPRPPMQAAECHLALGNKAEALSGLNGAIEFAGNDPKWADVKAHAKAMRQLLTKGQRPAGSEGSSQE
jgi:type III secretion system low calcium response chaperone LcrH/SycD